MTERKAEDEDEDEGNKLYRSTNTNCFHACMQSSGALQKNLETTVLSNPTFVQGWHLFGLARYLGIDSFVCLATRDS